MQSTKTKNSSSSEDNEIRYATIIDEKKRRRMISNRESARRSRMKREQHIKDLNDQVTYFRTRSSDVVQKVKEIEQRYAATESENRILRMEVEELKRRLELLDQISSSHHSSKYVSDAKTNPLPKPWLQPQTVDEIYQL